MGLGIRIAGGAAALVLLGGGAFGGSQLVSLAEVGSGYKAKILCSEVFVAGRAEADVTSAQRSQTAVAQACQGIDDSHKRLLPFHQNTATLGRRNLSRAGARALRSSSEAARIGRVDPSVRVEGRDGERWSVDTRA